jgi:flagellar basal body-associated protein FliL
MSIDENLNLTIELVSQNPKPRAIHFNRDILENTPFRITNLDYYIQHKQDTPSSNTIIYRLSTDIGIKLGKISGYGVYELPSLEIELISISNPEEREKFITAPQEIELYRPLRFNILLIVVVILSALVIMGVGLFVFRTVTGEKGANEAEGQKHEELTQSVYKRFLESREKYIKDKNKSQFLNSVEKILISFTFRKNNVTNIDDFYQNDIIPDEEKIRLRSTLKTIEFLKSKDTTQLSHEELDNLAMSFSNTIGAG